MKETQTPEGVFTPYRFENHHELQYHVFKEGEGDVTFNLEQVYFLTYEGDGWQKLMTNARRECWNRTLEILSNKPEVELLSMSVSGNNRFQLGDWQVGQVHPYTLHIYVNLRVLSKESGANEC